MHQCRSVLELAAGASLFLLLLGAGACSNDDGRAGFAGNVEAEPYPGCEGEFFGECQYWEDECQERVFDTVRCMRGSPNAEMPEVVELTVSELVDELEAELEADETDPTLNAAYNRAMALIGLAEEGGLSNDESIEAYVESVAAYYTPSSRVVTIVVPDDGSAGDDYWNTVTLAHEFVHAIQDQEHDLESIQERFEKTYDGYLATRAAIEGEATLFQLFYDIANSGTYLRDVDFRGFFAAWLADTETLVGGYSPLLTAPQVFPYTYGSRYVYNVFAAGGVSAVRALQGHIPATTLDVLESEDSVVEVDLPAAFTSAVAPPEGYTYVLEEVMGAWMLRSLIELREFEGVDVSDVQAWNRDHVAIYSTAEGQTAVVWRLELARSGAATALREAFSNAAFYPSGTGHSVTEVDGTVTLLVTDDAAGLDAWNTALESGDTVTLESASADDESDSAARSRRIVDLLRRKVALREPFIRASRSERPPQTWHHRW